MKIKVQNLIDHPDCKQVVVLPHIQFWWTNRTYCFSFGWLIWDVAVWFGDTRNI
jgi:hypothetical protein